MRDRSDQVAAACERQRARLFPEPGDEPEFYEEDEDAAYERHVQDQIDNA